MLNLLHHHNKTKGNFLTMVMAVINTQPSKKDTTHRKSRAFSKIHK